MTKDEFEEQYAERSGLTVARLQELGRGAVPCHCEYSECEGWQMVNLKEYEEAKACGED